MSLPFTRKETDYIKNLIEQEKLRLIEDVSLMESRANHTPRQKELLKKLVCKNYFDVESHIRKSKEAVKILRGIESQLYPSGITP